MIFHGDESRTHPTCPWCGNPDDCQPATPGQSIHHRLCCLDQYRAACLTPDGTEDRIMRDAENDRWTA